MKTGCILLAGGKGSRLGIDKTRLEINGESLLQRVVSNVDFLDSEIIIVTAEGRSLPDLKSASELREVKDLAFGKGPLMGLYTGLTYSNRRFNFVLACDMPFLNRDLVKYMFESVSGYDVVMPLRDDRIEPLHAVYSRNCLGAIEDLLTRGELKIEKFLRQVKVRFVLKDEIERFDPGYLSFFNINRSADVEKATALLKGELK